MRRRSGICVLLVGAGAGLVGSTSAAGQTVLNPSFEDVDAADGGTGVATGYGVVGANDFGAFDPIDPHYPATSGSPGTIPGTGAGSQVLFLNDIPSAAGEAFVFQNVGTVAADTTYSLTVAIGNRTDLEMDTFAIRLVAADTGSGISTTIGQFTGDAETFAANGSFADATAVASVPAGSEFVGDTLQLQFVNTNGKPFNPANAAGIQVNFDNVRLVAVPEPASLGLVVLGAAGLLARRRRRA